MAKDISASLADWDYDPDRISVRIIQGDDGREKIQLRLDLGMLQMEFDGRPDGKRVDDDCESWLQYFQKKQKAHDAANPDGAPFRLESEECVQLLREGVQYYHRYISFWHLERYELCARDTSRNLKLFSFVRENARHHKDKLQFDQWRPYVTMMHARAVATPLLELEDYRAALGAIDAGVASIQRFLAEYDQSQNTANCPELVHLEKWREEVAAKMTGEPVADSEPLAEPQSPLDTLQAELDKAVDEERFEDAANLRDQIRRQSEREGFSDTQGSL